VAAVAGESSGPRAEQVAERECRAGEAEGDGQGRPDAGAEDGARRRAESEADDRKEGQRLRAEESDAREAGAETWERSPVSSAMQVVPAIPEHVGEKNGTR
jgi:hypothetical protein